MKILKALEPLTPEQKKRVLEAATIVSAGK